MSLNLDNSNGGRAPSRDWNGLDAGESARSAKAARYLKLRLYVAAHSMASRRAKRNLKRALEALQPDEVEVEIIDAALEPERAAEDGVRITPMLVRVKPEPRCKVGGTLDDQRSLLAVLSGLA